MEELISIITPTYNCGNFIGETIESVINQTYKNWEMIIVDDCSTDNTKEIVDNYSKRDSRIKYYCLEVNSGAAVARTKAMELAKGDYIAFLDSDDLWMENKLGCQIKIMKENNWNFTSTDYEQIDEDSKSLNKVIKTVSKIDYNRLLLDCPVGNSTVMYNVKEKYIHGINKTLMKYRIRNNSISSNKLKVIKYHWILYRDIEHLSIIRSIFHICYWCIIKIFRIK